MDNPKPPDPSPEPRAPWNWAVGVMTCPRRVPALPATLRSLANAGWEEPDWIVEDRREAGHWLCWRSCLATLVESSPEADAYLVIEDDVVFCRDLRPYLEAVLWPDGGLRVGFCSPYSCAAYMRPHTGGPGTDFGFNRQDRDLNTVGTLATILTPESARAVLAEIQSRRTDYGGDQILGHWAAIKERSIWYHNPSLAQHTAETNSVKGDRCYPSEIRHAGDFIGEHVSPMKLVPHLSAPAPPP